MPSREIITMRSREGVQWMVGIQR